MSLVSFVRIAQWIKHSSVFPLQKKSIASSNEHCYYSNCVTGKELPISCFLIQIHFIHSAFVFWSTYVLENKHCVRRMKRDKVLYNSAKINVFPFFLLPIFFQIIYNHVEMRQDATELNQDMRVDATGKEDKIRASF